MTRSALRDLIRSEWPADVTECRACLGSGGDFDGHERCDHCMGRGYVWPLDRDPVLKKTLARSIQQSDLAAD